MVVQESNLHLTESNFNQISPLWKGCQIFLYIVGALAGVAACGSVASLTELFASNCILYSKIKLLENKTTVDLPSHFELPIDIANTEWEDDSLCQFCQYVPICSLIYSVIWGTFFFMCSRGGKSSGTGLPQPWRILYPALFFNFIFLIVSLVSAIIVEDGLHYFCKEFIHLNNETDCYKLENYSIGGSSGGTRALSYMVVAKASSWLVAVAWILGTCLLVLRCCCLADFVIIQQTIEPIETEDKSSDNTSDEGATGGIQ